MQYEKEKTNVWILNLLQRQCKPNAIKACFRLLRRSLSSREQRYDGFSQTPKNCNKSSLSCCDGVGDLLQRGRIG